MAVATSNGLAAGCLAVAARLGAVQELAERDAFLATCLHSLPRRRVGLDSAHEVDFVRRGGEVMAFEPL